MNDENPYCTVDLRVSQVESILVDVPGRRPHQHSAAGMRQQSYVILRVYTDGGLIGLGEVATAGGPWWSGDSVESVQATIDHHLGPALIGENATDIGHAMRKLDRVAAFNWFAKAALEMALFDIAGKAVGRPVHALLGGQSRARVPVTWPLGIGNAQADVDEALQRIESGISRSFKIKMGSLPLEQDLRRTIEIAHQLQGKAELRVDLNAAWTEPMALRHLPAIIEAGIVLVEQPIQRWNVAGHARLASRITVPLMADEGLATSRDAMALADANAVQVFALKLMKSGGIMACRDIAVIAAAHGIGLFGGCFLESSIGTAANLQLGASLPELEWGSEWIGPLWLADDLVAQPIQYVDFGARVPDGPGLGVDLDLDKLAFYRRDKRVAVAQTVAR